MSEQDKKEVVSSDKIYPPLDGFDPPARRSYKQYHVGYTSPRARECVCGSFPVIEQYVLDKENDRRRVPAQLFVAICPNCERRAVGEGSPEQVLASWNAGRITEDSELMQNKISSIDIDSVLHLSDSVVGNAVRDAVDLVKRKHEVMKILKDPHISDMKSEAFYNELKIVKANLRDLQKFFMEDPIMMDKDGDALLSAIRKLLYPGLTTEKRLEIPLDLVKM